MRVVMSITRVNISRWLKINKEPELTRSEDQALTNIIKFILNVIKQIGVFFMHVFDSCLKLFHISFSNGRKVDNQQDHSTTIEKTNSIWAKHNGTIIFTLGVSALIIGGFFALNHYNNLSSQATLRPEAADRPKTSFNNDEYEKKLNQGSDKCQKSYDTCQKKTDSRSTWDRLECDKEKALCLTGVSDKIRKFFSTADMKALTPIITGNNPDYTIVLLDDPTKRAACRETLQACDKNADSLLEKRKAEIDKRSINLDEGFIAKEIAYTINLSQLKNCSDAEFACDIACYVPAAITKKIFFGLKATLFPEYFITEKRLCSRPDAIKFHPQ